MGDVLMLGGREVPTTGPVEIGGGAGALATPTAVKFDAFLRFVDVDTRRFIYGTMCWLGDRRQRRRGRRRLAALDREIHR